MYGATGQTTELEFTLQRVRRNSPAVAGLNPNGVGSWVGTPLRRRPILSARRTPTAELASQAASGRAERPKRGPYRTVPVSLTSGPIRVYTGSFSRIASALDPTPRPPATGTGPPMSRGAR